MRQKKFWFTMSGILAALAIAAMLPAETAAASTFKVLYKFKGVNDGAHSYAGLIADGAGNLYGTTWEGGSSTCDLGRHLCGTVFKLTRNSDGSWTESVLYRFTGGTDGSAPFAGLVFDSKGNLYGTTSLGGTSKYCCGTVFELIPNSNGTWTESILYRFSGRDDGMSPYASLTFDGAGNLYGTTLNGGDNNGGVVFKLKPNSDGTWTESVLHRFCPPNCVDGSFPYADLIFDQAGNLYGTTKYGGGSTTCVHGCGTVFKLTPNSDGTWTESVLYSFAGGSDGAFPYARLTFDGAGNLYGTTSAIRGRHKSTVFKLTPNSDGTWTESVLYRFPGGSDGSLLYAGLTFDAAGNLYGATVHGGSVHDGVIFRLAPRSGGRWVFKQIHDFTGNPDSNPYAGLLFDKAGKAYGTSWNCATGQNCRGTVFQVTP